MATETSVPVDDVAAVAGDWRLGLASGLLGGLASGALLSATDPVVLTTMVPALYGLAPPPDPVFGWVAHLLHASVLGIAFAAVVERVGLAGAPACDQVGAGVGFALAAWLVLSALAMPVWLWAVGAEMSAIVPSVSASVLAAHVAFGVVLGVVYFAFDAEAEAVDETERSGR